MPRPKGSKNKTKTVKATVDFAAQIAEKQSAKEAAAAEIASITANIDALKADLKTKKAELKSIDKEIARIEAKKIKAETKAAESAKKAEAEDVLKKLLEKDGHVTSVGDEGGFAPNLKNHDEAFSYIVKAIEEAGYIPGSEVALAIDAAASEFYQDGKYVLKGENKTFNNAEMAQWLAEFTSKYPLISIEDGMAESDWDGWGMLTASLGERTQLVGDDVFVTNPSILAEGIAEGVANSILIKLNQIGTVTETLDTIEMAKEAAYTTVVSHRSGETEDSFIADLAVGVNAGQIKTGSLCRSERMAKYNQLLRIEEELGDGAEFFGPMLAEYYALDESED